MRHMLTITIFAVLLLFQNQICQGRSIDDTAEDNSNFPDEEYEEEYEEYADPEDEMNSGKLSTDNDDDSNERGIESSDGPRIKRDVYAEDFSVGHGGLQDSRTHENLKSGETLSEAESRATATGLSVGNGWAVGYGKASVSGGDRGIVNGRRQAYNPGVETAEEFGMKSGKDIAIARVGGGGGRSGEGVSTSGGRLPGVDYPGVDRRTLESAYANGRYPATRQDTPDGRGTFDSGFGHEGVPTGPVTGAADDRGHDNGRIPSRPITGVADDRGHGNGRIPSRPITGVVDDRGHGNGRIPSRPITGVADDRGEPSRGQHGTDRRVDDRYGVPDMTGVQLIPTIDKDGRVVYAYGTDGRPTRVRFTDRNGGKGEVSHFFERKNLDNGLSGDRKVTGTSFRSGFSLNYGGGIPGSGGAVTYGNGNSGAVAYGRGIRDSGAVAYGSGIKNPGGGAYGSGIRDSGAVAYGSGIKNPGGGAYGLDIGNGPAAAYGSGIGDRGSVAFASGSGFVSGTGISLGDTYVGPKDRRKTNDGVRSTGFSLRQGTVMGNGKGYSRALIYT